MKGGVLMIDCAECGAKVAVGFGYTEYMLCESCFSHQIAYYETKYNFDFERARNVTYGVIWHKALTIREQNRIEKLRKEKEGAT